MLSGLAVVRERSAAQLSYAQTESGSVSLEELLLGGESEPDTNEATPKETLPTESQESGESKFIIGAEPEDEDSTASDGETEAERSAREAARLAREEADELDAQQKLEAEQRDAESKAAAAKAKADRLAVEQEQLAAQARETKRKAKEADAKEREKLEASNPQTSLWIAIGAGVAVLIILGCAVLLVVKRSGSSADDAEPAQPQSKSKANPERIVAMLQDLSNTTGTAAHELTGDTIQIGRAAASSKEIQSVVVRMKTVGRRHAVIEYRQHGYWLVDQGSLNGTYLKGERIHGKRMLHHGSQIQLESAEFEFVIPGSEDLSATVAIDPDQFIETIVASAEQAAAFAKLPATAAKNDGLSEFLDTAVNQQAPPQSTLPPAEINASGDTQDVEESTLGSGTVDFDVFGDASDNNQKS